MTAPRIGKKARSPESRTRRALRRKERRQAKRQSRMQIAQELYLAGHVELLTEKEWRILGYDPREIAMAQTIGPKELAQRELAQRTKDAKQSRAAKPVTIDSLRAATTEAAKKRGKPRGAKRKPNRKTGD